MLLNTGVNTVGLNRFQSRVDLANERSQELVQRTVSRDPHAIQILVRELSPIIRARVTRTLAKSRAVRAQGRNPAQEVEDLTQEVFLSLFSDNAATLRTWDPARGASLSTFVGMLAEQHVCAVLRSGRRRPWRDEEVGDGELESLPRGTPPEASVASRQLIIQIISRLRAELSPRGYELFQLLLIEEQPVEHVCKKMNMAPDAVYAWRSRLSKLVRKLASDQWDAPCATH